MSKAHFLKYYLTTNISSSLVATSPVGPGVVRVPIGFLEVAAVVVPTSGTAPGAPRVVSPLARPVCVTVLVTEGQAVVALASPVILVTKTLVLVEALVLVVEPRVAESLVLVVKPLVLEVAVEPVVVVEGLAVVAAAATVLLLPTKEAAKKPCARLILARSLPSPPSIGVGGAALSCGQEKPLLPANLLPSLPS